MKFATDGNYTAMGYIAYYYITAVEEDAPYHRFYNFAPIYEHDGCLSNIDCKRNYIPWFVNFI